MPQAKERIEVVSKAMKEGLDSIARWGQDNGAQWCRETARRALLESEKEEKKNDAHSKTDENC